jgi:predicted dehydrogenase
LVTRQALSGEDYLVALICSKTYKHLSDFELIAPLVDSIYIEKPLASSYFDFELFRNLKRKHGTYLECGFMMRFHPCVKFIKSLLQEKALGEITCASFFVGQWLPDWRPNSDYRKSYSARTEEGGGVVLDLIHEIDLAHFLLGEVEWLAALNSIPVNLEIATEGVSNAIMQMESGANVQLHLDYVHPNLKRQIEIVGTHGSLVVDLISCEVWRLDRNQASTLIFRKQNFDRNSMFLEYLQYFLTNATELQNLGRSATLKQCISSCEDGIRALQIALAIKSSSESKKFVGHPYGERWCQGA